MAAAGWRGGGRGRERKEGRKGGGAEKSIVSLPLLPFSPLPRTRVPRPPARPRPPSALPPALHPRITLLILQGLKTIYNISDSSKQTSKTGELCSACIRSTFRRTRTRMHVCPGYPLSHGCVTTQLRASPGSPTPPPPSSLLRRSHQIAASSADTGKGGGQICCRQASIARHGSLA